MAMKSYGLTLGVTATLALAATGATWSSTAHADDALEEDLLDVVIVTARRRDEQSQEVPITTRSENPCKQRQWSQELLYAATGDKIDYVVGLYGFYQTVDTKGLQEQDPFASRWSVSAADGSGNPAVLDGLRSQNDIGLPNT